jgi:hypothetical protein
MKGSCPWITYEIESAWNSGKGISGIRIHNLKDQSGAQPMQGDNPFDNLHFIQQPAKYLSSVAALHYPLTPIAAMFMPIYIAI